LMVQHGLLTQIGLSQKQIQSNTGSSGAEPRLSGLFYTCNKESN
jgi:hypothetical protein